MDERLEAGRHHLVNGSRALDQGYPDDARAFYRAALLQFRGPELRLGEAHALRGLARVDLAEGDDVGAERSAERAVAAYDELLAWLADIDPEGISEEIRRAACEGLSATWILLAELHARRGDVGRAGACLDDARRHAAAARSDALRGDVEAAWGRFAMRQGDLVAARGRFADAARAHRDGGNGPGEGGALLLLAEACRLGADDAGAREALDSAAALATAHRNDRLAGRVAWTRAALDLGNGDLVAARIGFETALPVLRRAGDLDMEAHARLGLAEVTSRRGEPGFREAALAAGRRFGASGDAHGVATVLLVAAEHALRVGEPSSAALLAEGARRCWLRTDPVRGVGQALRILARALAGERPQAALWAAFARVAVAGDDQPGAAEVARWHLDRATGDDTRVAAEVTAAECLARAAEVLRAELAPAVERLGLSIDALGTAAGAASALEVLIARLPDTASPSAAPAIPGDHPADEEQPTGAFVALGASRAGKGGTPSPAPARGAYPARSDEEGSR